MNSIMKWLMALALLSATPLANAQLTSVDNGLAATDANGLMWANTVGINLFPSNTGGGAQAWVDGLNASNYDGHNDWTLATGDGSQDPGVGNTTTNQLGELFFKDCGNSTGGPISFSNPGKDCTALSALIGAIASGAGGFAPGEGTIFSSSYAGEDFGDDNGTAWWAFTFPDNGQSVRELDETNDGIESGYALAVRRPPSGYTTQLYSFCSQANCMDGANPTAGLIQATNGNLYGTTLAGGSYGSGTLFKITPTGALTTLYNFCSLGGSACTDGAIPNAKLIQGADGNLYGTTQAGGTNDGGTVFRITPAGTLVTLYRFCSQVGGGTCLDGAAPSAGLVQGIDGNLYGTTPLGGGPNFGGTVFKITPTGVLTTLYSFHEEANFITTDPANMGPGVELVQGPDGNFYGTTPEGGTCEPSGQPLCGAAFKISPTGTLTTLASFTNGHWPQAGLVLGADGNFYGTTYGGGANNWGTVFQLTPAGVLNTLYSFCSQTNSQGYCTDGNSVYAKLIQGADGNLYGTTQAGGTNDGGTVFRVTPTGTLTTLYSFCAQTDCTDGTTPGAGLVQDTSGNVYGMTESGGANGAGLVFKVSTGNGPFVTLQPTTGAVGATVKILGSNLTGAKSVTFNGTKATFKVVSTSEITTKLPVGATTGTVQVVTPHGTLSSNVEFTVESKTATPVISPKAGTYVGAKTVKITDATGGAVIYYTTDGTTPPTSSTASMYVGPITVSSSETVKAVALGPDDELSAVKTAIYTIN